MLVAGYALQELAALAGGEVHGDGRVAIRGVATLEDAHAGDISFFANDKYRRQLADTDASAVILKPEHLETCPTNALVTSNPYLSYARIASLLNPVPDAAPSRHPTAVIAASAKVDAGAEIGALAVVGEGVSIGPGCVIGPGCIIGNNVSIGAGTRLVARVTLCADTVIGERCVIHPGAVVGSDGFGLANDRGSWVKVPQLGRVVVGDDVDIGANTTIDRGSLRDTIVEDGVKLDNLIQVAHNVRIGAHTAIAGCTGIAGSTTIGRHCIIGGLAGIAGHLEISDGVTITGMSLVTRSMTESGSYSGNLPAVSTGVWRRMIARMRHIDELFQRVRKIESALGRKASDENGPSD